MNKKLPLIFIFVCALIFIFGCDDPANLINQNELQLPSSKGAFSLSIDGARTILPDTTINSFQVYTLEFTGMETLSEDRTNANLSTPINLQAGTYSLTVTAYMDTEKTKLAAVGSLTGIVITAGQVTNYTISLTALGITAGKGAFSWNIDFPDGLIEVKMKITPVGGLTGTPEQTLYFKGGASQVKKIDSVDLNSGMYRVLFTLIKNENTQTVIWRDVVHVYQNMTSVFNYTFTEAHFNNIRYTITFVNNDGTDSHSQVNRLHGDTVSVPDSPSRTGYIFDDWYTDNGNFRDKWVFNTAVITGDLKLYAKWNPISYTVVYNKGVPGATGETANSSHTYDEYKTLSVNGYSYTNYTFAGWARTEKGVVEFINEQSVVNLASENNATVTLYARWGSEPYYIEYNKNSDEAEGNMTNSTFFFGIEQDLKGNSFIRAGYTFAGWAKTSGGSAEFADKQAVLDLAGSAGATVKLYAKWTVHKLTVNYANGGGTGSAPTSPTSADYGTNVTMPDNLYTRTGYTFAGWVVSGTGSLAGTYAAGASIAVKDLSNAIKTGNASITLTAKWTAHILTINYAGGGGDGSAPTSPLSAAYGTSITMPVNPYTRTGYTFAGWEVSGTGSLAGTHAARASVAVTALSTDINTDNASITLTATWTANTLTINYANGSGLGSAPASPRSAAYGTNVTMPDNTYTRNGYAFVNWAVSGTGSISGNYAPGAIVAVTALSTGIITGNATITLTATWTAAYTVTFNKNNSNSGSTEANPRTKIVITPATNIDALPTAPTRTGYIFNGWNTQSNGSGTSFDETTPVSANITVYAQWTANVYTVTFIKNNNDSGSTDANPSSKTVTVPTTMIDALPTAPIRTGYTFAGWNTQPDGSGTTYVRATTVSASITVYAQWTANTYTVTFNKNNYYSDSTEANPRTKTVITPATTIDALPTAPTQTGYTFTGWNTQSNGSGTTFDKTTPVSANITVYAQWTANVYTVTFNKNNNDSGSTDANPASKTITYPTTTIILPTAPRRTGYTFDGWNTQANGGGTSFTATTTISENITVYAQWIIAFTSVNAFQTWLNNKPANTADAPYVVTLNTNDLTGIDTALKNNRNEYVYLDLSSSNITTIPDDAFSVCSNLTDVIIPNSVKSIGNYAFYVTRLTSVTIPNSVTSIGSYAFYSCTSLTSVTIPNSVTSIGDRAFNLCGKLTEINVDSSNTAYSSQDGVLYNKNKTTLIVYPEGKTSNSFTIPNSVTIIGEWAFYHCTSLTSLTIPNSVTSIGGVAFANSGLTSITIPDSVTSIGFQAFVSCSSLTTINVDASNTAYSSQDGVLYNKNKTSLIAYPAGKTGSSFTIPDSVTSIDSIAFMYCNNLTRVIIPDSVTKIGIGVFQDCTNLTSVTFQGTIPSSGFNNISSTLSSVFLGDLRDKFYATNTTNGTPGTYTTTAPVSSSSVWTKN